MKPMSRLSRLEWGFRAVLIMLVILWILFPPHTSAEMPGQTIRVVRQ